MYTALKSNSHYAPRRYTNQTVFKSLLNCTSEISLSRNATGREFQRHCPATEKLLSLRRICVVVVKVVLVETAVLLVVVVTEAVVVHIVVAAFVVVM